MIPKGLNKKKKQQLQESTHNVKLAKKKNYFNKSFNMTCIFTRGLFSYKIVIKYSKRTEVIQFHLQSIRWKLFRVILRVTHCGRGYSLEFHDNEMTPVTVLLPPSSPFTQIPAISDGTGKIFRVLYSLVLNIQMIKV